MCHSKLLWIIRAIGAKQYGKHYRDIHIYKYIYIYIIYTGQSANKPAIQLLLATTVYCTGLKLYDILFYNWATW